MSRLSVVCLVVSIGICSAVPIEVTASSAFERETSKAIYVLLNQYRVKNQLPPLMENAVLARVAQNFAAVMASKDKLDHFADGNDPGERMRDAGYNWCSFAENIARSTAELSGSRMAKSFMQTWINSPGHRANMLKDGIRDVGIGIASDGRGRFYAVQTFGRLGC